MQRLYKEFGRLLREKRSGEKLTQQAVADRVGLSRTSVTNIELGKQHIPLHMLFEFASAVNASPDQLLPKKTFASQDSERLSAAIEELTVDDKLKGWIHKIALKGDQQKRDADHETRGNRRTSTK